MKTASQILAEHRIARAGNKSAYVTVCPQCSHTRRKKRDRCLSVLIDGKGARWCCHHCQWHGHEFFDEPRGPDAASKPVVIEQSDNDEQSRIKRALEIWKASVPLIGSPGESYLRARKITKLPPGIEHALRFHSYCPFDGARRPCVVALFRDVLTNEPKAIHRIAPINGGPKAERMSFGPKSGCAVKLWSDEAVEQGLVIGEGIETTLAAALGVEHRGTLLQPAWAAGSDKAVAKFPILPGIESLTILVDNDASQAGQDAARKCAARWLAAGREVIRLIPRTKKDFNDITRGTA